jgi:two-component system, LytTR family, sensor kinase
VKKADHNWKLSFAKMLTIAFVLSLVFIVPWIIIMGEGGATEITRNPAMADQRIFFFMASIILSGLILIHCNAFLLRTKRSKLHYLKIAFVNTGLVILLSLLTIYASTYILGFPRAFPFFVFFRTAIIAIIAFLITNILANLHQTEQDQIRFLEMERRKNQAELNRLKNQTDPHFLFNSLTSLTGLIRQNPKEAVRFVDHLSETFRYALEHHQQDLVTLEEELNFIDSYLYMMRVRFGKGLVVTLDVPLQFYPMEIPHFSLQLLIENAIKHNVFSETNPLYISIYATAKNIEVKNNLSPRKHQHNTEFGIGLNLLNSQLRFLNKPALEVVASASHYVVKIPF